MQLSKRLTAIANMVSNGNRLVDVGCDHGYLPVYLILSHKIPSAIAMDVRTGPLQRAKEHIGEYKLAEYIETRLGDGLRELSFGEGDSLVIAGMGGPLMERILREGASVLPGFQELILQPQSDIPRFRRFIRNTGWEIVKEEIVLEDGKYYPLMKAVPCENLCPEDWTEEEYLFGKYLLEGRHPVLKQYLLRELNIRNTILEKLSGTDDCRILQRRTEIEHEKEQILHTLERWESA